MKQREYDLELKKFNHAREKFWIGGVVLVVASAIINWQIQKREILVKQIEEENKHLSQFVENILDKDPNTRLYISEYFQTLSHSPGARKRWKNYKKISQRLIEEEKKSIEDKIEFELKVGEILEEIIDPSTNDERRKDLQKELILAEIDIEQTKKKLEALNPTTKKSNENPTINSDSNDSIFKNMQKNRVKDTNIFPYNTICLIRMRDSRGIPSIGTGVLIHPLIILTAAYNILPIRSDDLSTVTKIGCGLDESLDPIGRYSSRDLRIDPDYAESRDPNTLGAIIIQKPAIVDHYLAVEPIDDEALVSTSVTVSGYSVRPILGAQSYDSGKIERFDDNLLFYDVKTGAGVGGAPILSTINGEIRLVGIHTSSNLAKGNEGLRSGVRVNEKAVALIRSWIADVE